MLMSLTRPGRGRTFAVQDRIELRHELSLLSGK